VFNITDMGSEKPRKRKGGKVTDEQDLQETKRLPVAQPSQRIDFDNANVHPVKADLPRYLLVVPGIKPSLNIDVDLVPCTYIERPEFWDIEVVGRGSRSAPSAHIGHPSFQTSATVADVFPRPSPHPFLCHVDKTDGSTPSDRCGGR
jgi:hypothetical protein